MYALSWKHYTRCTLYSLGTILNFQWMTSFAERSYMWPKWLPKIKALLTLILQCVHIERNVFTSYQEEYFLYTMSLWVCYRNFKAFVQDIPGSMISRANESWFKCPKKSANKSFGLIVVAYVNRHELNFFPGNLIYQWFWYFFIFYAGLYLKSWKRLIITSRKRLRLSIRY